MSFKKSRYTTNTTWVVRCRYYRKKRFSKVSKIMRCMSFFDVGLFCGCLVPLSRQLRHFLLFNSTFTHVWQKFLGPCLFGGVQSHFVPYHCRECLKCYSRVSIKIIDPRTGQYQNTNNGHLREKNSLPHTTPTVEHHDKRSLYF